MCIYFIPEEGKKTTTGRGGEHTKSKKTFLKKKKDLKLHSIKALVSGELENLYNADFREEIMLSQ